MKRLTAFLILMLLFSTGLRSFGQMVSREEAALIAHNYIRMMNDRYGDWSGKAEPYAHPVQELRFENKLIGYYCNVFPEGFIVMSLRRELEPVKAASDRGYFDPTESDGPVGFLKSKISSQLNTIESAFGSIETVSTAEIESICQVFYKPVWESISGYVPGTYSKDTLFSDSYVEGQILLSTSWHQSPPYNNSCPYLNCNNSNGNAVVGCVATAAAQIMRYWAYPPWHSGGSFWYDWRNMKDQVYNWSPQAEQIAVAAISAFPGLFAGMNYGCDKSGVATSAMIPVYKDNFFYKEPIKADRDDHSPSEWQNLVKNTINQSYPIQYRIEGHSIVCDGWKDIPSFHYHMNWGWSSPANNTWYSFDALPGSTDEDYMLLLIKPICAVGAWAFGSYPEYSEIPWSYFEVDAWGSNATFHQGQWLQLRSNVKIIGTGTSSGILFKGSPGGYNTHIFTGEIHEVGIALRNGQMRLKNNGTLRIH